MQPFRFIHCGDLHLGAPFQYATGISRAVDRAVSESTYVAFDTIIDTAIDEHVNAVVITLLKAGRRNCKCLTMCMYFLVNKYNVSH